MNSISSLPAIKLGILNYQPIMCLRDLKLNYYGMYINLYTLNSTESVYNNFSLWLENNYCVNIFLGKLVSTKGCVIRVGRAKYLAQWMVFACSKCHLQKLVKQLQEIYTLPKKCNICGTVKFYPVLDSPCVKSVLFQIIRIQEPLNDEQVVLLSISGSFIIYIIRKWYQIDYFFVDRWICFNFWQCVPIFDKLNINSIMLK